VEWPPARLRNRRSLGTLRDVDRDTFDAVPLEPSEATDSDEIRNDDGDEVVDPPQEWIEAEEDESLDERLADEVPDVSPDDIDLRDADKSPSAVELMSDDNLDHIDPEDHGRVRGQIDGTPEDGDSFFDVVE
jgi:hypothetical protein